MAGFDTNYSRMSGYLEHLIDSLSSLCRCFKVQEALAFSPKTPLTFINATVFGAVDLKQKVRKLGGGREKIHPCPTASGPVKSSSLSVRATYKITRLNGTK